jgi:hypothetical protein
MIQSAQADSDFEDLKISYGGAQSPNASALSWASLATS